jgi:hypothetical protein
MVTDNLIAGGQGTVTYELAIPPPVTPGVFVNSQPLRLYAQPGTTLTVNFNVTAFSVFARQHVPLSLSGYFVNAQSALLDRVQKASWR